MLLSSKCHQIVGFAIEFAPVRTPRVKGINDEVESIRIAASPRGSNHLEHELHYRRGRPSARDLHTRPSRPCLAMHSCGYQAA
jgi:hypothetical protein